MVGGGPRTCAPREGEEQREVATRAATITTTGRNQTTPEYTLFSGVEGGSKSLESRVRFSRPGERRSGPGERVAPRGPRGVIVRVGMSHEEGGLPHFQRRSAYSSDTEIFDLKTAFSPSSVLLLVSEAGINSTGDPPFSSLTQILASHAPAWT